MPKEKQLTAPENEPADLGDLAANIRKLGEGMEKLLASGLNRKAVVVLLKDHTSVPQRTINVILDGLQELAKKYTVTPG